MTREELIAHLSERFYGHFAVTLAQRINTAEELAMLYALITQETETLPRAVRHQVLFRGAYVLEYLYFDTPERFAPHIDAFCNRDFVRCCDGSARRHFGKIMTSLLRHHRPAQASLEAIADCAATWAVEPRTKAAVRIWAIEVLNCCRERVPWVAESWEDVLAAISHDALPSIACRLRRLRATH